MMMRYVCEKVNNGINRESCGQNSLKKKNENSLRKSVLFASCHTQPPKTHSYPPLYPNDHSYMLYCDPIGSEIISELVDDDEICVSEGEYHHELKKCWSKVVEKKKNENSLRKSALFLFIPIRPLKTYSYPPLYPNDHSYMMYCDSIGSGIISQLVDDDEICV